MSTDTPDTETDLEIDLDDGSDPEVVIEPGLLDRTVKRSGLERITSASLSDLVFEDAPQPSVQDYARVQRAFKHTYAVEREGGQEVVGAIKVAPGPMSMYDKDELLPHIHAFAAILSSLPNDQRGMLVDVPRSVDYTSRRERAKNHQRQLEAQIDNADDDEDTWALEMQADIAEERASVENFYQHTTSKREHYIVLSVSELDAARALSGVDGGLADLEIIGRPIKERRVDKLKQDSDLTALMVRTLNKRLEALANHVNKLHGIDARAISSLEYSEVIADAYRPDDVSRIKNFQDMVRRAPVPDGDESESGDPIYAINYHEDASDVVPNLTDYATESEVKHQYRTLITPEDVTPETDGAITLDETYPHSTRSTTIAVTGWPEVPPMAYLEELYRYEKPGVNISTALHWVKKSPGKAKRDAQKQENSLEDRLDGAFGTLFEDYLQKKYQEAKNFNESIEGSKYSVFDAGLFITIEATTRHQREDGEYYHSDQRLEDAIEDVTLLLKEESGFDCKLMSDRHEEGWQTSIPIANNELGTNVTLRADGLARQWAYQYQNREDPEGVKVGLHEYLREPTAIDFYGLENGHNIGLYGTIGSGKTTTMQELYNALRQYLDAEEIPFKAILGTPLRDHESLCEAYGGRHVRVGTDSATNPLNVPYVPPENYKNVRKGSPWQGMLTRFDTFLAGYYNIMNYTDLGKKRDTWVKAAKEAQRQQGIIRQKPETYRFPSATIPDVIDVLEEMINDPEKYVRDSLEEDEKTLEERRNTARKILNYDVEPFEKGGIYSHFCERSDVNLMEHDLIYLDFRDQEGDEQGGGLEMMQRLSDLHEQQKAFSGRTFMGIDEFHYMLTNPMSKAFFDRLHRHSRHWFLSVCLATQEFGDLFETVTNDSGQEITQLTSSAKVIFNNQAAQFYHATKEMNPEWAEKLGLTKRSENFVSDADMGKKTDGYAQALLVVGDDQYPLRIEMSDEINPRQFAIYQHDPTDHPPLREFLQNYTDSKGRDVCNWRWA